MGSVDSKHYVEIKKYDKQTKKETHCERIPANSEKEAKEIYIHSTTKALGKKDKKVTLFIDWEKKAQHENFQ